MPEVEEPEKQEAPPETDVAQEKEAQQELAEQVAPEEEIAVAPVAVGATTASTMAFDKPKAADDTSHLERGVHHWESYKKACEAAGRPEKWQDKYRQGHTDAKGWTNPHEHQPFENRNAKTNDWELKTRTSASQALRDWLSGPTIADFRSISVAKDLDDLRAEIGDTKFDDLCGSADEQIDKKIPASQRLRISASAYGSALISNLRDVAFDEERGRAGIIEKPMVEGTPAEEKPKEEPSIMIEPEAAVAAADHDRL
jgi:hypothetical protein